MLNFFRFQAVIFDINGVVLTDGTKKLAENLSQTYDPENVKEALYGETGNQYRRGLIQSGLDFFSKVKQEINASEAPEELLQRWFAGFIPISENLRTISDLRKLFYRVHYITNGTRDLIMYIDQHYDRLIRDAFDGGVRAYERPGFDKRDTYLYELAVGVWGANVSAKRAIYVDHDTEKLRLAGEIGMTPILYTNPVVLRESLNRLGVFLDKEGRAIFPERAL